MKNVHHAHPNTYADTLEDCLLVREDGFVENASSAEYWGGNAGDSMLSYSDYTDGPRTRLRYLGERNAVKSGAEGCLIWVRLLPRDDGELVVSEHHQGQGYDDCAILRDQEPLGKGMSAVSVEKWVPKEKITEVFPVGRRFTLVALGVV